ncbi:MAG: hypothetical protein HFG74_01985 [Hungatella sp.]|jgi:hypothetical protein|nr:hypothetical protein [Hungatella sp.]
MNTKKYGPVIDWFVISVFLITVVLTTTVDRLWEKFTYIAPIPVFFALCLLLLNHVSVRDCLKTREKEFILLCVGIILSGVNIILIRSNIGAFFTITNFLLFLYLADKVRFSKAQLTLIAAVSLLILFYWLFINREIYGNVATNPNRASLFIFIHFCVFVCFLVCFLPSLQASKRLRSVVLLLIACGVGARVLSLHCRGVFLAVIVWAGTYYVLPKKKFTVSLVISVSLLIPVVYLILWKSGIFDGVVVYGKNVNSGRNVIWYEFLKVFIRYPITGIGSDFDRMLPDLYAKDTHHALLDLLFVHGIPVFMIVLCLMYRRIRRVVTAFEGPVQCVCIASIYGILSAGSFENFYIVSPCNMLFLMIFVMCNSISTSDIQPKTVP